jgi:hypothetical protein
MFRLRGPATHHPTTGPRFPRVDATVGFKTRHRSVDVGTAESYFLRIPVSVLLRLCDALVAAGVSTALPCDAATEPALVCGVPRSFPVVP